MGSIYDDVEREGYHEYLTHRHSRKTEAIDDKGATPEDVDEPGPVS